MRSEPVPSSEHAETNMSWGPTCTGSDVFCDAQEELNSSAGNRDIDALQWMVMQATFGPFYRIEQLILSTTPAAQAPYQSPSGLPAILTDANIRLLFQMQRAVDALAAPVAGSNASATLQQVCYKPLGNDCATQSVLQARLYPGAGILQTSIPSAASCRSFSGMTNPLSDPMGMLQAHHAAIGGLEDQRSEESHPL